MKYNEKMIALFTKNLVQTTNDYFSKRVRLISIGVESDSDQIAHVADLRLIGRPM